MTDTPELPKPYGIFQSRTIKWLIGAGIAAGARAAILTFGLPLEFPVEIQDELTLAAILLLEVVGAGAISFAAWFRMQAKTIIGGWWAEPMEEKGP